MRKMMSSKSHNLFQMVLAAMFLALALVLPFLTGQIPQIGNALCPMHIPILLCGFVCGPWYALTIGFIAPLLRFLWFGMPPIMPTGIAMCFELAAYGFLVGLLYKAFPKKTVYIYISMICSMLAGRVIWGVARVVLYGLGKSKFGWSAFISGAFINAIPGIIVQIVLIPILVMAMNKIQSNHNSSEDGIRPL
jgi:riboflavin transporter FmnP